MANIELTTVPTDTIDVNNDILWFKDVSETPDGINGITPANLLGTDLVAIRALSPVNDDILQRKSGAWTNRTLAQLLTDLGLGDAMIFKGAIDCSANPNYPAANAGDTYRVSVAGKIGGGSGPNVQVGDTLICNTDSTASGTHAGVGANWVILQVNIDGAVIGPASAVDNAIARFDGTSGKLIQDYTSGAPTISDTGVLVMANNIAIKGRNAANNADVDMLSLNTSDEVVLDGGTFKITDSGSTFYFESKTGADGEKAYLGKGHYAGAHLYSSDGYVTLGAQSGGVVVHSLYSGSDAVVRMRAGSASQPILRVHNDGASQTADMQQWSDDTNATNVYSRINKAGYFITKKNAAPADGDIGTSELAIWFDNTSGAAKIKFKAKDSGGTVRTGEVALT